MHDLAIDRKFSRSDIMGMEDLLRQHPEVYLGDSKLCPLRHSFADGIYVREIFIPAGTAIVGAIHKHDHPNFLMSGTVRVATEEGYHEYTGPMHMISKAGTKRALVALTDLVWVTVHSNPTNETDVERLKNNIIADSYPEFDKFISRKNNPILSFFKQTIQKLCSY